jgi:sugar-specific transcriptional regulator TrmB
MVDDSNMDSKHVSLIELFEVLGITEKGIEKVYAYLLENNSITDIKDLGIKLDLPVKRIYKIVNVLKDDLGLIQIYDRPMKIQLLNPIESITATIEKKKNEIHVLAHQEMDKCNLAMENAFAEYGFLEKEEDSNPVEFLTPSVDNKNSMINFFINSINVKKQSRIAKGVMYKSEVLSTIESSPLNSEVFNNLQATLEKIFTKSTSQKINVLVSNDFLEDAIPYYNSFPNLNKYLESIKLNINIEIRVSSDDFSNFSIKDDKYLVQPSFAPNKEILGYFMTTNSEIVKIFMNKFKEIYENAIEIDEYINQYGVGQLGKLPISLRLLFSLA